MSLSNPRRLLFVVLIWCAPAGARAQEVEGNPANWCRSGFYTHDEAGFRLGKIVGAKGARINFYADMPDGCPGAGARCRAKSYLIPGDVVVLSRRFGEFVCAWFPAKKGAETVGWLPAASVTVTEADVHPPSARWAGTWEYAGQSLDIRPGTRAGALRVEGRAFWRGLGDNVHVGEVVSEAAPVGNALRLEEGEDLCRVTLRLVGDFLVVSDNLRCGGANVTFNGIYRRKPGR